MIVKNTNVAETIHLRQLCREFIGPLESVNNNFFQKYVNHNKTSIYVDAVSRQ
jgi:hypothetical protein